MMGVLVVCALLVGAGSPPAVPAQRTSILILPIEGKGGVTKDSADLTTQLLASEIQQYQGFRVVTFAELQSMMTAEMMKQLAACESNSCAAEVAGALNADEIVVGHLGKVGDAYVLSVTRIRSRDASVLGRASDRVESASEALLLERMPALVSDVMSGASKTAVVANSEVTHFRRGAATPPEESASLPPWRLGLRAVGAFGLVAAAAVALMGTVSALFFAALLTKDLATGAGGRRGVTGSEAALGNATFYGALLLVPAALLGAVAAGATLGASWVIP